MLFLFIIEMLSFKVASIDHYRPTVIEKLDVVGSKACELSKSYQNDVHVLVDSLCVIPLDSECYSAFAANKSSFASRNWNVEFDKACFMKPILTFTALI